MPLSQPISSLAESLIPELEPYNNLLPEGLALAQLKMPTDTLDMRRGHASKL